MLPRKWFYTILYWRKPRWDTGITPPELFKFISNHSPGRGLDLGCGTGTNSITLAQHGWEMIGIDFVIKAIKTARKKARQANVRIDFRKGDVTDLKDISGDFQLILDIGCYHSLPLASRPIYRENLNRFLCSGGTFLLYGLMKILDTPSSRGLRDEDIDELSSIFYLRECQQGSDKNRPSAWYSFVKL